MPTVKISALIPEPGTTQAQELPPEAEDIHLDEEKKAAIIGAMKNVRLDYVPTWATRISERELNSQIDALADARKLQRGDP